MTFSYHIHDTSKSEFEDDFWSSLVYFEPCQHLLFISHRSEKYEPTECPSCRQERLEAEGKSTSMTPAEYRAKKEAEKKQKAKEARELRKQMTLIKPLEDGEINDDYPEAYSVKVKCGEHNLCGFYGGKTTGLEAAVEKHFRKAEKLNLLTGVYQFIGVSHEGRSE